MGVSLLIYRLSISQGLFRGSGHAAMETGDDRFVLDVRIQLIPHKNTVLLRCRHVMVAFSDPGLGNLDSLQMQMKMRTTKRLDST